eukprot:s50_g56.t1
MSETHLTQAGVVRFRQELRHHGKHWRLCHGAPAPAVSTTVGTIGGKHSGVGILSNQPIRPLSVDWSDSEWNTARIQASAIQVQSQWVKVGNFYGYAHNAHTKATKEKTDQLLQCLTQKIVHQSRGYRAILGDFNATSEDLPQFAIWREHGFRELQEIAATRWNRPIEVTCKGTSTKDMVWVSPELAAQLLEVHVCDTYFPDHAIVYGKFAALGAFEKIPTWFKPHPLPWSELPDDLPGDMEPAKDMTVPQIFQAMETQVDAHLRQQGKPGLLRNQRGRCTVVQPKMLRHPVTPVKPSRRSEYQIEFHGESFQHTLWCRQLRRLQSFVKLMRTDKSTQGVHKHREDLWSAIRGASGFPGGFPKAWLHRVHVLPESPVHLPKHVPTLAQAEVLFLSFKLDFAALEKSLNRHRRQVAKDRRKSNPNVIYADVARTRGLPIQTIVTHRHAVVTEIADDGLSVRYEPPTLQCDQEIFSQQGWLLTVKHEPGRIELAHESNLEVGDQISQQAMEARKRQVFRAFFDLWDPLWNKHRNSEPSQWEPFVSKLKDSCPQPAEPCILEPISLEQWQAAAIWWQLAHDMETAVHSGSGLSGYVTDVRKCYNTLPRPVVFACAVHFGIPLGFVRAWHEAISPIQRHFLVEGACSPGIFACTGYPEGDPLSVAGMALLNAAMHYMVEHDVPLTRTLSFVDNWEGASHDAQAVHDSFQAMETFASAIDVTLDQGKTFFWAVQAEDRKLLVSLGRKVCHHATDLGGHLNYTRRFTNYTVRARIAKLKTFWDHLSRSPAPQEQKLRAVTTVAWPRCLHAIAGVALGNDHLGKLRSAVMAAMRWNKKGASPILQSLLWSERCDPAFFTFWETLSMLRNNCVPEQTFPVLSALVRHPPRHFDPGPLGVFLARIHQLNWQWDHDGFILDHEHIRWHILDSPVQLLRARLKHAWTVMMGSLISDRSEFQGMQMVDCTTSRCTQSDFALDGAGLLRTAMNGTFYTRNNKFMLAKLHGWFVEDVVDRDFRKALMTIPDTTGVFEHVPALPSTLHLFVDGSCLEPQNPRLRLATWGVTVALLPETAFTPVALGGVPGLYQTILRAELCATIAAVRFALVHRRPFWIWTDNQLVYRRVREYSFAHAKPPKQSKNDHDLWTPLFRLMRAACRLDLFQHVVTVASHQRLTLMGVVDKWAVEGNDSADRAAARARQGLPAQVLNTWHLLRHALTQRETACRDFHKMLVLFGLRCVETKTDQAERDEQTWEALPKSFEGSETEISLVGLPGVMPELPPHTLGECLAPLHAWLLQLLSGPNLQPLWLSSYQLFAHFQWTTAGMGFRYLAKEKRWELADGYVNDEGFNFIRLSAWLQAIIKVFAKLLGLRCEAQPKLPYGTTIRSWQRCLCLRVIPFEQAVAKIRVAAEARSSPDFLIIARTDARTALGLDEALRRARAFAAAGADILFVEAPESEAEMATICSSLADTGKPLLVNCVEGGKTPLCSKQRLIELGYQLAIYPATGFLAMGQALTKVYRTLSEAGDSFGVKSDLAEFKGFCVSMGFQHVWDFDKAHADLEALPEDAEKKSASS